MNIKILGQILRTLIIEKLENADLSHKDIKPFKGTLSSENQLYQSFKIPEFFKIMFGNVNSFQTKIDIMKIGVFEVCPHSHLKPVDKEFEYQDENDEDDDIFKEHRLNKDLLNHAISIYENAKYFIENNMFKFTYDSKIYLTPTYVLVLLKAIKTEGSKKGVLLDFSCSDDDYYDILDGIESVDVLINSAIIEESIKSKWRETITFIKH